MTSTDHRLLVDIGTLAHGSLCGKTQVNGDVARFPISAGDKIC